MERSSSKLMYVLCVEVAELEQVSSRSSLTQTLYSLILQQARSAAHVQVCT